MKSFIDTKNRNWSITITLAEIEAIQDATGIDFGQVGNFEKAFTDTKSFKGMLWPLIAGQAAAMQLDPKGVLSGFNSQTVEAASRAVAEELIDFFPHLAPQLRSLTGALTNRAEAAQANALAKIEIAVPLIEAGKLDKELGLTRPASEIDRIISATASDSSNSATDSAALPASIPAL